MKKSKKLVSLRALASDMVENLSVLSDEELERQEKQEKELERKRALDNMKTHFISQLPVKIRYYSYNAFSTAKYSPEIINDIKNFLTNDSFNKDCKDINAYKGLLFWGLSGAGKSVLLARLAKNIIEKDEKIVWLDAVKFSMQIDAYKKAFKDETELLNKLANCDNLFIDDITNNRISKNGIDAIGSFIYLRDMKFKRRTFASSNGDINYISQMYGVPTASRLNGMVEVKHIDGKDWRKG